MKWMIKLCSSIFSKTWSVKRKNNTSNSHYWAPPVCSMCSEPCSVGSSVFRPFSFCNRQTGLRVVLRVRQLPVKLVSVRRRLGAGFSLDRLSAFHVCVHRGSQSGRKVILCPDLLFQLFTESMAWRELGFPGHKSFSGWVFSVVMIEQWWGRPQGMSLLKRPVITFFCARPIGVSSTHKLIDTHSLNCHPRLGDKGGEACAPSLHHNTGFPGWVRVWMACLSLGTCPWLDNMICRNLLWFCGLSFHFWWCPLKPSISLPPSRLLPLPCPISHRMRLGKCWDASRSQRRGR